ncbi:phosphotransferase family protein [Nocardia sp. NBC_00565]|uniref:phosphotransferase family protein n=1 Tax=Nocardia sp. NBC_00565 TaxID=2975993 RepID=UPI002E8093E7|nr:phosphotransferase family protein [Nocardia sp. NBC_00565]WUC04715.1 phosphotransferase family protein [Nocardia sp. NBC_00565]
MSKAVTELDFDLATFGDWLTEQTGQPGDLQISPMRGGGSCELFKMTRHGRDWVIRRAPSDAVSETAHDVVREYKIYDALQHSDVPVPELLAVSADPAIIGCPFFVMEFIDGTTIRKTLPDSYIHAPAQQRRVGEQLIDTLAALHNFEWKDSTLLELANPHRFLDRQVDRWLRQLATYRVRDLPGVDEVADWLQRHLPRNHDLAVMHGDYKLDNVLFSNQVPPTILSVLDFEMTTIGDPLIDLAWAMIFWPEEGNTLAFVPPGQPGGMDHNYCQTPLQLVSRYADRTSRDLSNLDWYKAFSAWKLAIVLEASYAKHLSGRSKNPMHEYFGTVVDQLLIRAHKYAS